MTTEQVEKVHCDRCKRIEERPLSTGESSPTTAFAATLFRDPARGVPEVRSVGFTDLCGPCLRTVTALFEQIGKKIDGLSPERKERGAKKKEVASSSKATSKIIPPPPAAHPARG